MKFWVYKHVVINFQYEFRRGMMSLSEPLQEKCRLQCKVLICVTEGLNQHVILLPGLLKSSFLAIYLCSNNYN